jgi:hypothetical protein
MPRNANQSALPWRFPAFRALAFALALGCGYLTVQGWRSTSGPLKPFYLATYARLSFLPNLPRVDYSINRSFTQGKTFEVLLIGSSVATTANLSALSGTLSVRSFPMEPKAFCAWLKQRVYEGQTVTETVRVPLYLSMTYLGVFFFVGYCLDARKLRKARNGLTLRGPGLVSRWRFNRKTRGNGLAFRLSNWRNLFEMSMPGDSGKYLCLKREDEAHHIQIVGDTGSGKTTLIRQILSQVRDRNELAIIFDPDRQYIQEFFDEARGDYVLNPLDERCPYWEIESEAVNEAEATSIALSAWPNEPNQQPFFKKHPRAIFAYLISRYNRFNCPEDPATCESLARWLASPRTEITPRLEGTRHAVSTDANAKDQSQGLWATLGEIATPLEMMPPFDESRREWTVRNWVKERKGWLFITSTPKTLDALRPLQSLWLDMLILALQNDSDDETRRTPVWLIIDELASLHVLPQLITALTKQRKSGNPIVTGFQNMAQLRGLYGQADADTITSQAFSNFILRTREPNAAEHLSGLMGKAQLERLRESQPSRLFEARQGTYNTERVMEPVVMASEIQTLPDMNGYFVQKASIVPIRFKRTPKRAIAPGLVERTLDKTYPPAKPARATGETQAVVPVANRKAKDLVFEEIATQSGVTISNTRSHKPC